VSHVPRPIVERCSTGPTFTHRPLHGTGIAIESLSLLECTGMGHQTPKLTEDNQGYWDRIKRARSWVERARALDVEPTQREGTTDLQEPFIMYWIAFNAMYGRVNESGQGRYLRPGDDDARWFLRWICDLDAGQGRIEQALADLRRDAHSILKSRYLSDAYWREGYSSRVKRDLEGEARAAEEALDAGDPHAYVTILLWRRIRVLRNQVFHGCSTNRDSLNKDALDPALKIVAALIPLFLEIMENRVDKDSEWPRIPFPRRGSPQHPKAPGRNQ
jgi:hypothetical protein